MKKADEILSTFFRMYNLEDGAEYVSFFESWQEIVGVDMASHSRVADIRNGAAIIELDHPGWMQMFQMKEKEILRRIQKRFPDLDVKSFSLQLVDQATWERRAAGQRKPVAPTAAADREEPSVKDAGAAPEGDDEVPEVPSPRLKDTLRRLKEDLEDYDQSDQSS